MKAIRSQQIHSLVDLFPGFIFPEIPSQMFVNWSKHTSIPEVAALLKGNRFLYDHEPVTLKDHHEGHMRNHCILKVSWSHICHSSVSIYNQILLCVLHGPSTVKQGTKSSWTRKVNSDLWGIKKTTILMLAFAATAVWYTFILIFRQLTLQLW